MENKRCIECNNQLEEKLKFYFCPICGYSIKKQQWYMELLEDEYWCNEALICFPKIIRDKYLSIYQNIKNGQVPAAWIMIRDIYEIALKVPIILSVSKLLNDNNINHSIIRTLTEKSLSLGRWEIVGETIAKGTFEDNVAIEILRDLIKVYKVESITNWRNNNIGHGAFSVNDLEVAYKKDLKRLLKALGNHFNIMKNKYMNLVFIEKDSRLYWKNEAQKILLYPFATIISGDIYCFDAYYCENEKTTFLNYLSGEKKKVIIEEIKELFLAAKNYSSLINIDASAEDDMFSSKYLEILNEIENQDKTIKLDFLNETLFNSFERNKKGLFLLEMEKGMGKTTFVKTLDPFMLGKRNNNEYEVRAFYINSTYSNDINYFSLTILDILRKENGNHKIIGKGVEAININSHNIKQEVATLLNKFSSYYNKKLVLIIDGIDEIPVNDGKTIFDLIPDIEQLNDKVYVLLTSRELDKEIKFVSNNINKINFTEKFKISKHNNQYRAVLINYLRKSLNIENEEEIFSILNKAGNKFLNLNFFNKVYSCSDYDKNANINVLDQYFNALKKYYTDCYFKELIKIPLVLSISPKALSLKELSILLGYDTINFKSFYFLSELKGIWKKDNSYKGTLLSLQRDEYRDFILKNFNNNLEDILNKWEEELTEFNIGDMDSNKISLVTVIINGLFNNTSNIKLLVNNRGFKLIEKWIWGSIMEYCVNHKYEEYDIISLLSVYEHIFKSLGKGYEKRLLIIYMALIKFIVDGNRSEYYHKVIEKIPSITSYLVNIEIENNEDAEILLLASAYIFRINTMIVGHTLITDKQQQEIENKIVSITEKFSTIVETQQYKEILFLNYLTKCKKLRREERFEEVIIVAKEALRFYKKVKEESLFYGVYYVELITYIASCYRRLYARNCDKLIYIRNSEKYYTKLLEEGKQIVEENKWKMEFSIGSSYISKRLEYINMELSIVYKLSGRYEKAFNLINELINKIDEKEHLGLEIEPNIKLKALFNRGLVYYEMDDKEEAIANFIMVKEGIIELVDRNVLIDLRLMNQTIKILKEIREKN